MYECTWHQRLSDNLKPWRKTIPQRDTAPLSPPPPHPQYHWRPEIYWSIFSEIPHLSDYSHYEWALIRDHFLTWTAPQPPALTRRRPSLSVHRPGVYWYRIVQTRTPNFITFVCEQTRHQKPFGNSDPWRETSLARYRQDLHQGPGSFATFSEAPIFFFFLFFSIMNLLSKTTFW